MVTEDARFVRPEAGYNPAPRAPVTRQSARKPRRDRPAPGASRDPLEVRPSAYPTDARATGFRLTRGDGSAPACVHPTYRPEDADTPAAARQGSHRAAPAATPASSGMRQPAGVAVDC